MSRSSTRLKLKASLSLVPWTFETRCFQARRGGRSFPPTATPLRKRYLSTHQHVPTSRDITTPSHHTPTRRARAALHTMSTVSSPGPVVAPVRPRPGERRGGATSPYPGHCPVSPQSPSSDVVATAPPSRGANERQTNKKRKNNHL